MNVIETDWMCSEKKKSLDFMEKEAHSCTGGPFIKLSTGTVVDLITKGATGKI